MSSGRHDDSLVEGSLVRNTCIGSPVLASTSVGSPHSSGGKESACSAGDPGSIPGSGRSPGKGNGNPLQYSCLENPMDRGAWRSQSMGLQELDTT